MRAALTIALVTASLTGAAVASAEDDLTSLSYISYLERYATVQPADQEDHLEALINMPLVAGDRIDTAREARVEIRLADGSTAWLDEYSSLSLDAIAFSRDTRSDQTALYLAEGDLMLEIPAASPGKESTRVDGPSATVHLERDGLYRISTLDNGGLRVEVWGGAAEATTSEGEAEVRAGSAAELSGGQVATADLGPTGEDAFSQWVNQRRGLGGGEGTEHVDIAHAQEASQLDNYGNWVFLDGYDTWAWRPSVEQGWRPYTYGSWYWTPIGWSWLSYEPWGWLPYHYGSWWFDSRFGWVWSWGGCWGPAWVDWVYWPGYVGWCPSGYYDFWWWGHYGYWYGWNDWDHLHGGHGGTGHGQPPRQDVLPRPSGGQLPRVHNGRPLEPTRLALDLHGGASLRRIDPTGWNVVRSEDFASPYLTRLVQPGEVALRRAPNDTVGIVTSGPLVTSSPSREAPRVALDQVFTRVDRVSSPDLGPVLARDGSLEPAAAMRLVEPTTTDRISRRSPVVAAPVSSQSARSGSAATVRPERQLTPNIHRSTVPAGGVRPEGSWRSAPESPTLRSGSLPRSGGGTVVSPQPRSGSGSLYRRPVDRSGGTAPRGSVGSPGSTPSTGSRPVIVPNTSPSRPSRQLVRPSYGGSSRSYGSSMRSSPSGHSSSRSPSSRSSSPSSSGHSSGSSGASSPSPSSSSHSSAPSSGSAHRR